MEKINWKAWYIAVIGFLILQILIYWWLTGHYSEL